MFESNRVWVLPSPNPKWVGWGRSPDPKGLGLGSVSGPKMGLGLGPSLSGPKGLGAESMARPNGVGGWVPV